jgi:hypothetical protein
MAAAFYKTLANEILFVSADPTFYEFSARFFGVTGPTPI